MIQDLVVEVHEVLDRAGIGHVFGGALALIQYVNPRATRDIDLNVATPFESADELVDAFAEIGLRATAPPSQWLPVAGVNFERPGEIATVDVFFSFDPYHAELRSNAVMRPFPSSKGPVPLPFLSADDLVVLKLTFGRTRDWADIEAMAEAGVRLDLDYVSDRLVRFRGPTMYRQAALFGRRWTDWAAGASR